MGVIGGRSHCPHCQKQLTWYELIPLFSFIIQKGKCRSCKSNLSFQYPIVELLSGFIFVAVPLSLQNFQLLTSNFQSITNYQFIITAIWLLIFISFLLLSIIDFRQYIIPDSINLFLAALGSILIFLSTVNSQQSIVNSSQSFLKHYSLMFGLQNNIWLNHFFSAFLGIAFFGAIVLISRGRAMGMGDVKLAGSLGLIFGWPDIIMVLGLSFIVGSIFSVYLIFKKKKGMKDAVPFGPFLTIGSALTFFTGYEIINGYFKLFGLF